jgi:hypothetical protein
LSGYHVKRIEKGTLGDFSKILEEVEELSDALDQGSNIMALLELSDIYGSIQAYLEKNHPSVSMEDLRIMSEITRRAFESGER